MPQNLIRDEATAIRDLAASAALADAIAKDLFGYSVRITELENDEADAKAVGGNTRAKAKGNSRDKKKPSRLCQFAGLGRRYRVPPAIR